MLITFIAVRSLWRAWREHQQHRRGRRSSRQFIDLGPIEAGHDLAMPLWQAVLARYRKDVLLSEQRRARSRKAITRLSRISERKLAKASPRKIDKRRYTPRPH
jgi:hypothetical protein